MSAPFRTGLPRPPRHELLERPRLMDSLDGRFERRLTVLQAGAGFGKTTALTQAIAKNHEEPFGVDLWMACRASDDQASELVAGLCAATGANTERADPVRAVADALWKLSPQEVALIVDDAHHLRPGSEAAALLEALLAELPDNAHLVIASREAPPLATARLEAAGELCWLDESDLAFHGEEQTAFFSMRQHAEPAAELAGWPALCELAASSGSDRVGEYLWEEVLTGLSPVERAHLARLVPLEWIDAERIEAFTGTRNEPAKLVGTLPLTQIDEAGNARFHGLWQVALRDTDPDWTPAEVERAYETLAEKHHYREALDLCLSHGSEAQLEALTTRLALHDAEQVDSATLEGFVERMPDALRSAPIGRLLEGRFRMRSSAQDALGLLEAARAGFCDRGLTRLEVAALQNLSVVAYSRFDVEALQAIAARGREIDTPETRALAAMSEATRAFVERRPHDSLEWVAQARAEGVPLRGTDGVAGAVSALTAGLPERALEEVDAALPGARNITLPLLIANRFDALWMLGKVRADQLMPFDAGENDPLAENTNQTSGVAGTLAFTNATLGRLAPARRHLARSEAALPLANGDGQHAYVAARLAVRMQEGEPAQAERELGAVLDERSVEELHSRFFLRALPMAMIASARVRAAFAGRDAGPAFERGRRAAEALLAFREQGDTGPAGALPWADAARFRVFFVPRLLLELAVAGAAAGSPEASAIATELADRDRDVLRVLAGRPETRAVAKQLLHEVPGRPTGHWQLCVLGPMRLLHDGEEVTDPAMRRDRVRAILHFLAAHRSCRREALGTALWPELDTAATANNLRVNLNHLLRLLEPERGSGEPSFFVSSSGETIRLAEAGMGLDVDRFEALLEQADAADRSGDPGRTLSLLETALALYGGDYLEDAPDPSWGESDRIRLRSRFVDAALRAAALRLAVGAFDAALGWTAKARACDPLDESAIRVEALTYLRQGHRSAARSVLKSAIAHLGDEGVAPDAETRRLAKRVGLG